MKALIKLILSLEKLIKNPIKWFDEQPWLLRIILTALLVPLISAVSILSYQKLSINDAGVNSQNYCENSAQEINELKKDLERLHSSQMEELGYLSEDVDQLKKTLSTLDSSELHLDKDQDSEAEVLGVEDLGIENLRQRLQDANPDETELEMNEAEINLLDEN